MPRAFSPSKCFFFWVQMCESLPLTKRRSRIVGVGVRRGLVRQHDRYGPAISAVCCADRSALFPRYEEDFMGPSGTCCDYNHIACAKFLFGVF